MHMNIAIVSHRCTRVTSDACDFHLILSTRRSAEPREALMSVQSKWKCWKFGGGDAILVPALHVPNTTAAFTATRRDSA